MNLSNRYNLLVILLLIVIFPLGLNAQGVTGAQFLKIGMGAKANAMGEAYIGIADNPSAIYWNPAGISQTESYDILFIQNYWIIDMSCQYGSAVFPTKYGSFGTSVLYSSSGEIPKYENFERIGKYSAYDFAMTLAYSSYIEKNFALGIGLKYIYAQIEEESASAFAVDFGIFYILPFLDGLRFGLSLSNIGTSLKFIDESDPLPLSLKTGAAYHIGKFNFSGDIDKTRNNDIHLSIGVEYIIKEIVAIRSGYNSANSFSLGFGVTYWNFEINYAYVPLQYLDDSHQFAFRLKI